MTSPRPVGPDGGGDASVRLAARQQPVLLFDDVLRDATRRDDMAAQDMREIGALAARLCRRPSGSEKKEEQGGKTERETRSGKNVPGIYMEN